MDREAAPPGVTRVTMNWPVLFGARKMPTPPCIVLTARALADKNVQLRCKLSPLLTYDTGSHAHIINEEMKLSSLISQR